jgi:hypothetical protein
LLRSYGFLPLEGVVVAAKEDKAGYFEGNRTVLLPQMQPTDVTFDLMMNGATTLIMSTARAFETPATTDNSLTVTPMLLSGEGSYLRSLSGSTSLSKQAGDKEGHNDRGLHLVRSGVGSAQDPQNDGARDGNGGAHGNILSAAGRRDQSHADGQDGQL